ncbi:MAG TPA: beta-galactosidase GalB [Verrucomicrobiae bacterium]
MKIAPVLTVASVAFALALSAMNAAADNQRTRESLDAGWRFTRNDPAEAGTSLNYAAAKPWLLPLRNDLSTNAPVAAPAENYGSNISYAQPGFDDGSWRQLDLPHDFGIEGPFQQALPGETGKLPWFGVAWYRKSFDLPATDAGKKIYFDVDGAMAFATVWINGHCVGGWPYGYASWRVDLTPFVKFGGANTLAVRLDNPKSSSRWYPGGGIYRNVWLVKTAPVHIAHWGTAVTTPVVGPAAASVVVKATVQNETSDKAEIGVETKIFALDANGAKQGVAVAQQTNLLELAAGKTGTAGLTLTVANPKLWDIEQPNRYVAVTTLSQGGKVCDVVEDAFGIRTAEFTRTAGFLLNGKRVPLNGVCDHHDLGALGAAINVRALQRQLEILRQFGCNAIRTSHNPPTPELLDLCDQMGFVVMDEAFDCWATGKNKNDYHILYADWHEPDLRALVRRDRNHPSVILWSSGNEVPDQDKAAGPVLAEEHRNIIHSEDPTRPCTDAVSSYKAAFRDFAKRFDAFGWNYKPDFYGQFRGTNADIPLFGSETSSTVSSRGEYFFPTPANFDFEHIRRVKNDKSALADFQVSSYDYYVPGWATLPDTEWVGEEKNPFVAGEFVWTGFDYLGEPTPYNADLSNLLNYSSPEEKARAAKELAEVGKIHTPSRSSYFGIVDLAGFPKDRYYLYQAHWRPDYPMAHILPHWNWPGREGQVTPVHVYTSGDEAELFLNGQSLGRKKKGEYEYRLRWDDVKYAPGTLKVVAYKNGVEWATDEVRTTGAAAELLAKADRANISADGKDLSFVTITVADKDGLLVPRSKNHITFDLTGGGEIVAVDNGDATSFEPFQAKERNAYNGLALVIVRATQPGQLTLTAHSEGLQEASVKITAK